MLDILMVVHTMGTMDPSDNDRFSYIANMLISRGAKVEMVTSDFEHHKKRYRNCSEIKGKYSFDITFLHEKKYKKNVSLARILGHISFGEKLKKYLSKRKKPDVIYCAMPPTFSADIVAKYAKKNSYAFTIATYFVYFIMLGINNHGVRMVAKGKDNQEKSAVFWNLYIIQLVSGIIWITIYFVYCGIFKSFSTVSLILIIYVISGMLDINWFYFGNEDFRTPAIRNIIVKITLTVFIFLFVKNSSQMWLYCLLMACSYLFSQIIMWISVFGKLEFIKPDWENMIHNIRPLLVLFIPVIAVSLYNLMDRIMLGGMSDMDQLGFYESAAKIVGVPSVFTVALGQVMLPRASKMFSENEKASYRELYKSIDLVCFFSSGMAFGLMGVASVFTGIYYGLEFMPSASVMVTLSATLFFSTWASVIRTQLLIPKGKDIIYVISVSSGAGINLVLNYFLIPRYGAKGAAIATVVTEAGVALIQCMMINKEVPIVSKLMRNLLWLLPGAFMLMALRQIESTLYINQYLKLFIMIMVGIIIYFALATILILIKKIICRKLHI